MLEISIYIRYMKCILPLLMVFLSLASFAQKETVKDRYSAAIGLYQKGELEKAASIFEKIFSDDTTDGNALENKSIIYSELKQYNKAAEGYAKLCKLYPRNDRYFSVTCFYYTLINQPKIAESFGKKAVSLNKYRYNNMLNLAHTYLLQREKDQSIYWYTMALEWVPSKAEFNRAFLGDLF